MSNIAVKGGIGDFLQCVPFMLEHTEHKYLVASHYDRVLEFFSAVGLTVEELSLGRLTGIENCPRRLFFDFNPFPVPKPIFTDGRPVLGIHLGGSNYSISVEKRFGFPSKALPAPVLKNLIWAFKGQYNILVFGEAAEFDILTPEWRKSTKEALKFLDAPIAVSLSHVSECSALIGSDSAFKTMSAMLRIPTVVWVGDYKDDFRDSNFISPYVTANVMETVRYLNLRSSYEVLCGVELCQKFLTGKLSA